MMDHFKETTLKGHIQLCELRYQALEQRLDNVEARLTKIEDKMSSLKTQTEAGFAELKLLLERKNSSRQTQLIASIGAIVVAIVGAVALYVK